jgi:hypothetical protein
MSDAAIESLNNHSALRADPDPPVTLPARRKYARHVVVGSNGNVRLHMTPAEATALWAKFTVDKSTIVGVERRALVHLLLDHSALVCLLVGKMEGVA